MKLVKLGAVVVMIAIAFIGVYLCLYGGIVQFIKGINVNPIHAGNIAFGIVRVLLTLPCLWLEIILGGTLIVTTIGE